MKKAKYKTIAESMREWVEAQERKKKILKFILSVLFFLAPTFAFAYTPDIGAGYNVIISGAGQSISNGTYEPYGVLDLAGHGRQGYFNGTQYLVWCSDTELDINDTTGPCTTDYYWDSGGNDSKVITDTSLWHAVATSPAPTSVTLEAIGGGGGSGLAAAITLADSGIGSTTGVSISAFTAYAGDNLTAIFIGSGLNVLLALRWWIAAMLIIAGIIYFVRRGFVMYKH